MKSLKRVLLVQAFGCAVFAQQHLEVGAIGGFGFAQDYTITSPSGTAKAGFENGGVFGAFFGGDSHEKWGGEVRYLYRMSDPRISGTGGSAKFDGQTHIYTGNILAYFSPRSASLRPFITFGGGVKHIKGTGTESSTQPGGRYAALTNTDELLAVADVGAGIKYSVSKSVKLRFEVHDYMSKRPNKVIAPAPGTTVSGFLNDVVASASVSFSW